MLFDLMRDLKSQGVGIIFVTHFLEQVYEVSDRITVLRNGELVGEYLTEELPQVELVSKMIGKELEELSSLGETEEKETESAEVFYEAEGLTSTEALPFNFNIRKGEVNGFTGLLGSGRSESVRAIFGADKVNGGSVKIKGKSVKINKPIDAMKNGIGYLAEDRKRDGIIAELSVRENIILALQVMNGMFKPISRSESEAFADEYIKVLNIKTASRETPVGSLSGGNQQKVILARWLATDPDFLILDEPTRGIDIGTKSEIQKLIVKLAGEGKSVLFISSEIEEMLRTCSRMVIMRDGQKVGELDHELSQENVMKAIAGGEA
jgi:simple sugar transport system ATP-binding protein